jgi:hypothetical protein
MRNTTTTPIAEDFFCDGHYYLLTSSSLGGSGLTPTQVSETVSSGDCEGIKNLLNSGIAIPLFFPGDCALDNNTLFVVGELTQEQERDWIAKIECKLNIPCGKFVILCGGADPEELEHAISLQPTKPHYTIHQVIDLPADEYLVEIFAYYSSMTVQLSLEEYDSGLNMKENVELKAWYEKNQPGVDGIGYIIRFSPLHGRELTLPELDDESGWAGVFEFRSTKQPC